MICIHVKSLPNLAFIIPLHPKKKSAAASSDVALHTWRSPHSSVQIGHRLR